MKNKITLMILILFFSCNQRKDEDKLNFKKNTTKEDSLIQKIFENEKHYALSKLKLKPLKELKNKTLRIWRFPGGGAIFAELYELNIDKSELKFYSYLIREINKNETENLSELEFERNIKDEKIINDLIKITNQNSFLNIAKYNEYCKKTIACGDSYYVEFTNLETNKFFKINNDIKKCNNENLQKLKNFYSIIETLTKKHSH